MPNKFLFRKMLGLMFLVDGTKIRSLGEVLSADTEVVIQVFWHSSCGYCELQMEYASDIAKRYDNVLFVAMNVGESTRTVYNYWVGHEFEGVCLLGFEKDIAPGLPFTAILSVQNNEVVVVTEKIGLIEYNELLNIIKGLVDG
jgi:thiol-disulfide isomerase/thioredoxin